MYSQSWVLARVCKWLWFELWCRKHFDVSLDASLYAFWCILNYFPLTASSISVESSDKYCSGGSPELHGCNVDDPCHRCCKGGRKWGEILEEKAFLHGRDGWMLRSFCWWCSLLSQGFTKISQDQAAGRSFMMDMITKPVKKPVAVPRAGFNNVHKWASVAFPGAWR